MARAYRNKDQQQSSWWEELSEEALAERPSPNAPIEERNAWVLKHRGPAALTPEALDGLRARACALPGCGSRAVSRSLFCTYHQNTAVGEAGARELRMLTREMERLGRITDKDARAHAVRKFRSRVESGDFAILFSGKMQETLARAAEDAQLGLELGALRVTLVRALQEIEDPGELSTMVARLANASARTARASVVMWRESRPVWGE
jgi:hypothetical protein